MSSYRRTSMTKHNMTPVSAPSGIAWMKSAPKSMYTTSSKPQLVLETRVVPPALTFIRLWPTITQPPMPLRKPQAICKKQRHESALCVQLATQLDTTAIADQSLDTAMTMLHVHRCSS